VGSSKSRIREVNPNRWLRGGYVAADWRIQEVDFQDCVEKEKYSRSYEGRSNVGPSNLGGNVEEICVFQQEGVSEGNKGRRL
jgi:hypothetical protein